jgi:hypothetical protein
MTMTSPSPMGVYNGHERIGEVFDTGPGRIRAVEIHANGRRVNLGYFPTRRDAMRAMSTRHAGGPEPPQAA